MHVQNFNNFFGLSQYNNIQNFQGRLLDLVLSNANCEVNKAPQVILPEDPYHPSLIVETKFKSTKNNKNTYLTKGRADFNFKKANFVSLYDVINRTDWSFLNNFVDPNMAVAALNDKLDTIFENNVPRKKPTRLGLTVILYMR